MTTTYCQAEEVLQGSPLTSLPAVASNVRIKVEPSSPGSTPPNDVTCADVEKEVTTPNSPPPMLSLIMECVDIKVEPSSPVNMLSPDGTYDDIEEEIERPNSPVLSPVTDSVDIKVEPSSPTTVLAPEHLDSECQKPSHLQAPQPCIAGVNELSSSTETLKDIATTDNDPGTPGLTAVASTKQDEMADSTNESHERHEQAKDILCPICERPFLLKRSLRAHMLLHSRTRWFPCSICGKLFQQSSILVHERTHHERALRQRQRDIKTIQCSLCRTIFLNEAGLKTHMRSHTSKRPHECNEQLDSNDKDEEPSSHASSPTPEKQHRGNES
uniref:Zinc finger protein n=1 Tax=Rhipicephalus zambeziensis TaxID=60191 RepID=A0A224Z5X2_9ACAR